MCSQRAAFFALVCIVIHAPVRADGRRTRDVTIRRDICGVPHISGKTDADAALGLMYAQAEDNFWYLETDYARTLGRAAELEGRSALAGDPVEHAQEHYRTADPKLLALCDAFAAGVNRYLATHPQVKPLLLTGNAPFLC
jgi:acyl-homoserine lactone acylase PvdQ